jgi:O-antigen/teichoic acid export membrane protein
MLPSEKLPVFLRARLAGRDTLRRVFDNSFWLFCDQILRMAAGLLVGIWAARYLGPENYGWLNYAIATVGVVGAFASLGINAIVVREIVRAPGDAARWLGSALALRAAGGAAGLLACLVIASQQAAPSDALTLIVAVGLLFQAADVVDLLFQARGEARVSAWVRMVTCTIANVLKIALILVEAPLLMFAAAGVTEIALGAAGWWWMARRHGQPIASWRIERTRMLTLLQESWPLAASGLAISVQAYADQIVLGALLGADELGQYAAALRLVSVFAFVPMVVQTVAAPEITRAKRDDEALYRRRLHSLYRLMFGAFLVMALPLIIAGPFATRLLYGAPYHGAAVLLPWLALRLFFTNFGVARSLFITNEGLFRFALLTAVAGAGVNVALTLVLVPRWGAQGAIAASLASFAVTTFALEGFEPRARLNLRLMASAVLLPWRRLVL